MPGFQFKMIKFTKTASAILLGTSLIAGTAKPVAAESGFERWINGFYGTARKNGIKKSTYKAVMGRVKKPNAEILEKARYQPEFVSKMWDYLDSRITTSSITEGQQMLVKYDKWLDAIEKRYGVEREILLAIWSMESTYGKALERDDILYHLGDALGTLAYADKRRSRYARQQLIAAMKIVQRGDVKANDLVGSWAGAMGHTQFIPTSYQTWAVDIDGDGRRNVWSSVPDALASSANLLRKNGWRSGQTWGYEVVLPKGFNTGHANRNGLRLADFAKMGVKRANGKPFPRGSDKAVLKLFGGKTGPAFLMLKNFYVLKRYNNADKYALGVGHLADRIAGYGPITQQWPRGYVALNETERLEVQQLLANRGLYHGDLDGNIGSGSRKAIQQFQKSVGMTPDGQPSRAVLKKLRAG